MPATSTTKALQRPGALVEVLLCFALLIIVHFLEGCGTGRGRERTNGFRESSNQSIEVVDTAASRRASGVRNITSIADQRITRAIESMGSQIQVVDVGIGTYNSCHKTGTPLLWFYMNGHIRTFSAHSTNTRSFLFGTSSCWFVSIFTHHEIDKNFEPEKAGWSPNTEHVRASMVSRGVTVRTIIEQATAVLGGTNVAFASAKYNEQLYNIRGSIALGREIALSHQIPMAKSDVVIITRPDLVYSQSINSRRLHEVATSIPFVLMPHHNGAQLGGNDPSEMLVFGVRAYWEDWCIFHNNWTLRGEVLTRDPTGRSCLFPTKYCGYFSRYFIQAAGLMGYQSFFYFTNIRIWLHRITGAWNMGVMTGPGRLANFNSPVFGNVDITRGVRCAMQNYSACLGNIAPPTSKCWGDTERIKIGGPAKLKIPHGMWVCRRSANLDARSCAP